MGVSISVEVKIHSPYRILTVPIEIDEDDIRSIAEDKAKKLWDSERFVAGKVSISIELE
jgi:hypothetical protein